MKLRTFLLAVVSLTLFPTLLVSAIALWWLTQGLGIPAEQLEGPLRRSLWLLAGGAVVGVVLALTLAHLGGRRLAGRLRRLTDALTAFARGETVPELPEFTLAEVSGVTQALRGAMALLEKRTAELRESEQRYRTTFERNPAGMCLTLADGRIVDCNEAFARIVGFNSPADALAMNAANLYAQPKEREQVLERINADGTAVNVELQLRRRDGHLISVLSSVMRSPGPPRADYETTLIDITEHKAADELRSITKLANAAAHEINNPLTMVLGRLAMLKDDQSLTPEARARIVQINAAAERIREIVVDMNRLTHVQLYEHTGRGLPEMLDIRKSAGGQAGPPR